MLAALFRTKKKPVIAKTPWPSALNPCPTPKTERHMNSCLWNVRDNVTELCIGCVMDRDKEYGDRYAALRSFTPDPEGNPVKNDL